MQPIIPITKERWFCVLYRFDIVSLSMVFSYVSETSNLIPQPGYTHGTAPVPTALPPAHPVSCAGRHTHERIIFCNRGVRIIHYLQTLLWQAVTFAPILHGQHSESKIRIRKMLTHFSQMFQEHLITMQDYHGTKWVPTTLPYGKAEIYRNVCLSYSVCKAIV